MFSVIKAYLSHRVGCTRHNRTFLHCRRDRRRSQLCDEWLWLSTRVASDFVIPTWRCLFEIGNLLNLKISHEETYSSRY